MKVKIEGIETDEDGFVLLESGKASWVHIDYLTEGDPPKICNYIENAKGIVSDEKLAEWQEKDLEFRTKGTVYGFDNGAWSSLAGRAGFVAIKDGRIVAARIEVMN